MHGAVVSILSGAGRGYSKKLETTPVLRVSFFSKRREPVLFFCEPSLFAFHILVRSLWNTKSAAAGS